VKTGHQTLNRLINAAIAVVVKLVLTAVKMTVRPVGYLQIEFGYRGY
jgi:hypothetical protein